MDEFRQPLYAVAESLYQRATGQADTKYGPVARRERDFLELIESGDFTDAVGDDLPDGTYGRIEERNATNVLDSARLYTNALRDG